MEDEVLNLKRESLKRWLGKYEPCKMVVGVPEKVEGALLQKNFMVYPLRRLRRKKTVKRRFSEFEEVRAQLEKRFGCYGMLVPSLPPKAGFGTGDAVVKHRVRALNLFCERIEANPFLGCDSAWLDFVGEAAPAISVGQLRYMQALEKWESAASTASLSSSSSGGGGKTTTKAAAALAFAAKAQAKSPEDFHEDVSADLDRVKAACETLSASLSKASFDAEALRDAVEGTRGCGNARDPLDSLARHQLRPVAEALTVLVAHVAEYEQVQARELREMCRKLVELDRSALAARDREHRAKANGIVGGAAAISGGGLALGALPRDLAQTRIERERRAAEYRAGLTHWSLPRFDEMRRAALKKLSNHTALLASMLGGSVAAYRANPGAELDAADAVAVVDDLDLPRPSGLLTTQRSSAVFYIPPAFLNYLDDDDQDDRDVVVDRGQQPVVAAIRQQQKKKNNAQKHLTEIGQPFDEEKVESPRSVEV